MSEPQFITVAGRPARVRLDGDPANPPVLLLHGITRSLEDWSAQVTRLAQRYRVIAPDLPGFGYSARKPGPATPLALADGVAETLDALAETRACHVIGNSLGGTVAMQLLAAHPDRVGSLVLVNSAGFGSSVTPLLRLLTVPGVGRYVATHTTAAGARLMERQIFADPALATTERIEHALALGARPGNGAFVHELANVLGTPRGVRAPWRRTLLGAVTRHPRPTMIMWGDRDRILPARHFDAARTHFPHARTHMFAGVGHMPQIERPDEFARLVLPFLADAAAPADTGTAGSV